MIEVEKGVAIPNVQRRGTTPKYPWRTLEVGDSFFAPGTKASSMYRGAAAQRLATGFTFMCRVVDGGVRVWRVK
jgi:hypothetical protein